MCACNRGMRTVQRKNGVKAANKQNIRQSIPQVRPPRMGRGANPTPPHSSIAQHRNDAINKRQMAIRNSLNK